ncbi:hypothetical protein [Brevibacterium litoralis]|uniref:hypothetical protein n=1 Tax=Brevibacterium litoralis TaxID=3138935 RepID=UPI0032F02B9F
MTNDPHHETPAAGHLRQFINSRLGTPDAPAHEAPHSRGAILAALRNGGTLDGLDPEDIDEDDQSTTILAAIHAKGRTAEDDEQSTDMPTGDRFAAWVNTALGTGNSTH